MNKEFVGRGMAIGAIGFGTVAIAAPKLLFNTYAIADTADTRALGRMWGTRTALLGALALAAREAEFDRFLLGVTALNAADAVLAGYGAVREGTNARGAALSGATSALFAAAGVFARSLK